MLAVLRSSVDWFEYSCQGALFEGVAERLQELKLAAQELEAPQLYEGAALPLYVGPQGAKPWAWVLRGEDLHLRLTDKRNAPPASVRSLADGLATYGHEGLFGMSRELLGHFGDFTPSVTSRLDLAVDFQGWTPAAADMENVVCRAAYQACHGHYREDETFVFGQGALVVRIYNKTHELKKSGKLWLLDAWATCPAFEAEADVWRFEAQLRREGLQSFGVRAPADALDSLPALLASMLGWCSLRVPQGVNRSRWPLDPRWEELAAGSFASTPLPRVHEQRHLAEYEVTARQVKGHLLSAAALRSLYDFDDAWGLLGNSVRGYIEDEGGFAPLVRRRKAEKTGRAEVRGGIMERCVIYARVSTKEQQDEELLHPGADEGHTGLLRRRGPLPRR